MSRESEFPISFGFANDERLSFLSQPPYNMTSAETLELHKRGGLLVLAHRLTGKRARPRYSVPYTTYAAGAAPIPPTPERRSRRELWDWHEETASRLNRVAKSSAAIALMAGELHAYYSGILEHAVGLDDGRLYLAAALDGKGERPMDYVGIDREACTMGYTRRLITRPGRTSPTSYAYYLLQSNGGSETTVATQIVWHIPGGMEVVDAIAEQLATQPTGPRGVSTAQLFGSAEIVEPY